MELLIRINTDEAISLREAEELARRSRELKLTPGELAAKFIRDGLRAAGVKPLETPNRQAR